ncbi:transcriptional regulator family: C2H2 zinc finger [Purpureocillium lilacinum]|uniref:Transcriptional regulator family: C2H2 zinc finger n=1 Tax=Purpureocillium lilacinum TaxID=33203 RepID=A0ABR0BNE8_PURLI|nr:transcriptional regulator family: C2H2 zinc finger [Purpureocillium lilacinum]
MFDCRRCLRHFKSLRAQQQHVRDSPNHHVCHQCDDAQDFTTAEKLDQHAINVHNTCSICKRRFETSSNLRSHSVVHLAVDVECPGCDRTFVTESAMVLHLETGTCAGGASQGSVTRAALDAACSAEYTGENANFECPDCEKGFHLASALLQHAESDSCDVSLQHFSPLSNCLSAIRVFS